MDKDPELLKQSLEQLRKERNEGTPSVFEPYIAGLLEGMGELTDLDLDWMNDMVGQNLLKPETKLAALEAKAMACTSCTLCETRNKVVFSSGPNDADLMIVGEAPGEQEDLEGNPFIGASGKQLFAGDDKYFSSLGLSREDVYIANIIKCRPPNNRVPTPAEVDSCRYFIEQQIAQVKPKVLVALGKTAGTFMLSGPSNVDNQKVRWDTLRDMRKTSNTWLGIPIVVTVHPSGYLRDRNRYAAIVTEDMNKVKELLGI